MTTSNLADILVKCGVVQSYETDEQNIVMLGRIAEAAVAINAEEAGWQAYAEQSDKEVCELQDALGCPAELRLIKCARCDWNGTTRDVQLPGECPQDDCMGRLIDDGVADAQAAAMERIRDLIAQEAELAEACMDNAAKHAECDAWRACAERLLTYTHTECRCRSCEWCKAKAEFNRLAGLKGKP